MTELNTVVAGAAGRMGCANIRAIDAASGLALSAAFDRPDSPAIGKDAGVLAGLEPNGILVTADWEAALKGADVLLDFTVPALTVPLVARSADLGLAHIIGTTGLSASDNEAIAAAARSGARIVKAGNMSLGLNLLLSLVREAAAALGSDFDIEILEMHHGRKIDAPSGSALMLGEAAANARGIDFEKNAVLSREGVTGARRPGTIGFATLRGGTTIGDHRVIFAGPGERLEISHIAEDRSLFANGAVKAALWLQTKGPGLYTMTDVLGLGANNQE